MSVKANGSTTSDSPRAAAYTIFGTMVVFKVVTAIYIVLLQPSFHGAAFLAMTSGLWFALVAVPLLFGGVFWFRRLRARAKRRRLIEAEWNLDPTISSRTRTGR